MLQCSPEYILARSRMRLTYQISTRIVCTPGRSPPPSKSRDILAGFATLGGSHIPAESASCSP
eukprot:scaffold1564_cov389-Prasinococcus_capsulatus_cf.AAC.3